MNKIAILFLAFFISFSSAHAAQDKPAVNKDPANAAAIVALLESGQTEEQVLEKLMAEGMSVTDAVSAMVTAAPEKATAITTAAATAYPKQAKAIAAAAAAADPTVALNPTAAGPTPGTPTPTTSAQPTPTSTGGGGGAAASPV